jgi:hypothetical protein
MLKIIIKRIYRAVKTWYNKMKKRINYLPWAFRKVVLDIGECVICSKCHRIISTKPVRDSNWFVDLGGEVDSGGGALNASLFDKVVYETVYIYRKNENIKLCRYCFWTVVGKTKSSKKVLTRMSNYDVSIEKEVLEKKDDTKEES